MKIQHLAIWVTDLERMRDFYVKYFHASCGDKYVNDKKKFQSYFLTFDTDCKLELMHKPGVPKSTNDLDSESIGLTHFAIGTGSKELVDSLTELLRRDGYRVVGEPRTTGDGYYESVVLDPELNRIEITI